MSVYLKEIKSEISNKYSVVIEDNGRVAYGYLLFDDKIIGDVWLYNYELTPNHVNWKDKTLMPFSNPKQYAKNDAQHIIANPKHVKAEWTFLKQGLLDEVRIFDESVLIAIIKPGSKPGWSINAQENGPLAKVLDN